MTSPTNANPTVTPLPFDHLPNYLNSSFKTDETLEKVRSLIENCKKANQLISERSSAAPGYYAVAENPSYIEDVANFYKYFKEISEICKRTWNLDITE